MKKMFKKIASVFLITVMFFGLGCGKAGAAVDAILSFDLASVSLETGQTVTLVVRVNPGTNEVGGVELDVAFDPAVLQLDSITRSAAFNTTLAGPTIDNTIGTGAIDVGLITDPATYVTSTSNVATFVFTALAPAVNSPVSIASTSEASAHGEYVTATRTGAQVTVTDGSAPTVTAFTIPVTSNSLTVPISTFTATDNIGVTGYKLTETSTAPLAGDSGWTGTAPASYVFSSEGNKTLYAWAKDAAGNVSTSLNDSVTITLPTYTIGGNISGLIGSITLQNNSGDDLNLTENGSFTFATALHNTDAYNVTVSSQPAGQTCNVSNNTGTVSGSNITNIAVTCVDGTAPVVTIFTIPETSNSFIVPISTFTAADAIGVTGYILTESSSAPAAGASGWSASAPANYTFSSEGSKTLYAWAKDAAGNVSASLNDNVTITLPTYTIGGNISGLTGTVILQNNFGDDLSLSANGNFTFATALHSADTYNVSIFNQPAGQTCTASNNTGNISGANVTNIAITCADGADTAPPVVTNFIIPSTSSSLTVPISNFTATDDNGIIGYCLTIVDDSVGCSWSANPQASYVFSFEGAKTLYAWAKDAAGNVSTSLNDSVTITLPTYTIGGNISGLIGSITLQNNSGDDLNLTENGSFTFATALHNTDAYNVTVSSQPAGQTCNVFNNTGTVSGANVANVVVACVDMVDPNVTAFAIPDTSDSLVVPITTFTATDNIAVTGYKLTESSSAPQASDTGWTGVAPANYTFSSAGNKTLYAWAKDAAGNVSTSLSDSVTITLPDSIDPNVTAFSIPATATSLTVSITTFTATDNIAVAGYMLTESSSAPAAGASGWSVSAPTQYVFSSAGNKTLYAWAKDATGNVSSNLSDSVTITLPDDIDPTVTAFVIPATATSLTVSITTFSATDNIAVTGYKLTESSSAPQASDTGWTGVAPANYTFSSAGNKTLYAWAKDAAGNVSTSLSDSVTITLPDSIDPNVTAFSIPATATSLTVSITTFTATDNIAVAGYKLTESSSAPQAGDTGWTGVAPANYSFSSAGAKTLYAWAKDVAGNVSTSLSDSVTITLPDGTPPVVSAFIIPETSDSLTVMITSFTATDVFGVTGYILTESSNAPLAGGSGWSASAPVNYTFSSAGAKTLYAWARDSAGNVSTSLSDSVIITLPNNTDPIIKDPDSNEETNESGEINIDDPTINLSDDREDMDDEKRIYTKSKKLSFKGKAQGLENGKIKIFIDGELEEEPAIDNDGKWKEKIKLKKETTYIVRFEYFDAADNFIKKSHSYRVKIDTKDPDFDSMPLILNKRVGDKIWWNAVDDYKVDYYKYYFNGQKIKTKDSNFIVPSGTSRGAHPLLIRAYDKSGNKADKIVLVRVR